MKSWIAGLARLGLAGSCLVWTGCGGSDVPDPDSDSQAATDAPPTGGGPPPIIEETPAPAPSVASAATPPTPQPAAPAGGNVAAVNDPRMKRIQPAAPAGGGATEDAAPAPEAPAATAAADAPATGAAPAEGAENTESSSATNEMLALANSNAPAPPSDEKKPGAAGNGGAGAAGYPGAAPGDAGRPAGYPGMTAPGGGAGAGRKDEAGAMASAYPGMQAPGGAGGRGGFGGMPGAAGAGRPGANANAPADFSSPQDGVNSFLNALEAKDLDRLAEATAKHAPVDAREKNRKLFTEIADGSLSQEDLDDLAKRLEGYRIVGTDPLKSTGQIVVVLEKNEDGALYGRKITTRKEKAGWKVQDIGGEIDYYNMKKILKARGGK